MYTFFTLAVLVFYASSRDSPLPTRLARPPTRFFSPDSAVHDLFDGNDAEPNALVARSAIVVVMLYAPWSLHSVEARDIYEKIATAFETYNSTVQFVALNCHYHRGECRSIYKLYYFPLIFAYVPGTPVVFNRPITEESLGSWIRHLMRPYSRIQTIEEFTSFIKENSDHSAIAHLDLYKLPRKLSDEFRLFYRTAVTSWSLECAPIDFGVILNRRLAQSLGFNVTTPTTNQLMFYNRHANSSWHRNASLPFLTLNKFSKVDSVLDWLNGQATFNAWKSVRRLNFNDEENGRDSFAKTLDSVDALLVLFSKGVDAGNFSNAYAQVKKAASILYDCNHNASEHSQNEKDVVEPVNNNEQNADELFSSEQHRGKACSVNRTGFLAVERRYADYFVERWRTWSIRPKTDTAKNEDDDVVVLVSRVDEQFFWLDSEISTAAVTKLVVDFVDGNLSSQVDAKLQSIPSRPSRRQCDDLAVIQKLVPLDFTDDLDESIDETNQRVRTSVLSSINVSYFLNEIVKKANNFDAFVFVSGGQWHGPSQRVPHLLHVVLNYLRRFNNFIKFYMLNTSQHRPPPEYMPDSLPAFILFPARHTSESIVYPSADFPLSVPNLMAFILAHCQPALRWRLALNTRDASLLDRNIRRLREFVLSTDDQIRSTKRALRGAIADKNLLASLKK